jgi:hypothetical protein
MGIQAVEVSINLSQPGTTSAAIEAAIAALPNSSKFLGMSANTSSVFLLFDVPGHTPHPRPPVPPPPHP